jgi:hypothetical protein
VLIYDSFNDAGSKSEYTGPRISLLSGVKNLSRSTASHFREQRIGRNWKLK